MALSEIQNLKPPEDTIISTINRIPASESVKETDMERSITASDTDTGKLSENVQKATEEKIQRVSELMNDYVQSLQKNITIQVDNETGDIMVKVISEEDGKVIREIPSEELLALAARMEEISGAFFDQVV